MNVSKRDIPECQETVHIDVSMIPQHTQETLAAATLDFIHGILAQAGGRAALDKKIAELHL